MLNSTRFLEYYRQFKKYVIIDWVMSIPSFRLRNSFLRSIGLRSHPSCTIMRHVRFLDADNISIGAHSIVNSYTLLDGRGGSLTIGDNVDIAREVNIFTMEHDPCSPTHASRSANVSIGDHVWIASRVTILPGVCIGRGAVVACGAVVTKNVPEKTIVGGVPARVIGYRDNELTYTLDYRPKFR